MSNLPAMPTFRRPRKPGLAGPRSCAVSTASSACRSTSTSSATTSRATPRTSRRSRSTLPIRRRSRSAGGSSTASPSDFRQAGWGYTTDGGNTWTFPGVIEPGVFRSDPVLSSDADGNFFYNSLTADAGPSNFRCHVYKSIDGGRRGKAACSPSAATSSGRSSTRPAASAGGNIYAARGTRPSVSCSGNFTRSYDGGQSFEPCTTVAGDPLLGHDGRRARTASCTSRAPGMTIAKSSTIQDSRRKPAAWDFSRHGRVSTAASPGQHGTEPRPACWDRTGSPSINSDGGPTQKATSTCWRR